MDIRFLIIFLFFLPLMIFKNCGGADIVQINNEIPEKENLIESANLNPKPGDTVSGKVIKIHDGDTFDVRLTNKENIRIRMEGIDAPESGMAYYRVSKDYLKAMAAGKEVKIKINERESNGRYIGLTYLEDGRELSFEMLKAGLAWHYKHFNDYPEFAAMEEESRQEKRGLWEEDSPVPPWIHRRLRRNKISTKDLNPYRKREFEVTEKNTEFVSGDLELKLSKGSKNRNYNIEIFKNGKFIQNIQTGQSNNFFITLADYNMDGESDLKIGNGESGYFLFDKNEKRFVERKDWKLSVWKLNKPQKHILTLPEGTPYSGKVKLYNVDENSDLELLVDQAYY